MLFGAAIPFTVALVIYTTRRCRAGLLMLTITPVAMALCALWAVAPDMPRLLGMNSLYLRLSMDPRMDIFLWHYTIDQIEIESSWYAAGVALVAAGLMGAALRQLFLEERR
jgi:hypothetical protein